jgi:hypothetical protein
VGKGSKSGKRDRGRKASAKGDRALLELGEDLLTAVHLHQAIQEDEVRAALAAAHGNLVQAVGDLVARIGARFLEEAGVHTTRVARYARWAEGEAAVPAEAPDSGGGVADRPDQGGQPH